MRSTLRVSVDSIYVVRGALFAVRPLYLERATKARPRRNGVGTNAAGGCETGALLRYCAAMVGLVRRTTLCRDFLVLILVVLCGGWVGAQSAPRLREPDWNRVAGVVAPPHLTARSAILVDVSTRTVIYAKNPDLVLPPASLTKLVAIDAALVASDAGELSLSTRFAPPPISWAERQPPGSSLMFLGADQELTVRELLLGLSVSSGNDAAVALAEILDGGVPAFADRMNRRMSELGLVDAYFVEPSGLSPANSITARSFARFLLAHLSRFPDALNDYYAVPTFTFPAAENRVGPTARLPITQANRNQLIGEVDGVDGFKTGFIDESGYHLAATAVRDGRRLIALVLGIDADSHALGGALRAREAAALLEYGFDAFMEARFGYPQPEPVRIFKGAARQAIPVGPEELVVTIPVGSGDRIRGRTEQEAGVVAPLGPSIVGTVAIELDGVRLAAESLVLPAQERGNLLRRLWDSIVLFFRRLAAGPNGDGVPPGAAELGPAPM